MITPEIFEQQAKELAAINGMQFTLAAQCGYMLAAVVQSAAICLDLSETTQDFCKEFVNGFCDRYREQMPSVVKAIEDAWENPNLMTEDEFEETLGEKWERIALDIEREMNGEVKIIVDKPSTTFQDDDYITIITRGQPNSLFAVAPPNHDPETFDY